MSIRDEAVAMMSDLLAGTLSEAGLPRAGTPLFAFGRNGLTFACFVADRLNHAARRGRSFARSFQANSKNSLKSLVDKSDDGEENAFR